MKNIIAIANIILFLSIYPSSNIQAQTLLPGSIAGIPDVSQSGAFTYTIPLALPPGIKNIIPELSITYNSQAGNGLLGIGWNLAGLSSITRASSDIYHDGIVDPVNFNGNDVLMLDGSRLVQTGAPTNYETKVKDFSKITSFGSGPDYFVVERSDGLIYEYGHTSDARLVTPGIGAIHTWLLNRISDRNGNYIDFRYWNNPVSGDHNINQIKYAGNYLNSTPTSNEINFYYGTRADKNFIYIGGGEINTAYRLEQIVITHSHVPVHTYDLTYTVDFYSHLMSVTETGENGDFLPSTNMIYGGSTPDFSSQVTAVAYENYYAPCVADFNGDGMSDFFNIRVDNNDLVPYIPMFPSPPPPHYKLYKNDNAGDFTFLSDGSLPTVSASNYFSFTAAQYRNNRAMNLDYNGDGKDDLITVSYNATNMCIYLNTTNSAGTNLNPASVVYSSTVTASGGYFIYQNTKIAVGDFAGNGKKQLMIFQPANNMSGASKPYLTCLTGDGFQQFGVHVGEVVHFSAIDYDGDGKDELFTTTAYSLPAYGWGNIIYSLNTAYGLYATPTGTSLTLTTVSSSGFPNQGHRIFYGDFNGDAKTDVLAWGSSTSWHLGYAKGAGGFFPVSLSGLGLGVVDPLLDPLDDNYRIADFNGDGKDDILEIYTLGPNDIYKVYYSRGNSNFVAETNSMPSTVCGIRDQSYTVGDFNGDGQADLLQCGNLATTCNMYLIFFHKDDQKHLLKKVIKNDNPIPGSGQQIDVTYQPLPQQNDYTASAPTISYPFNKLMAGGLRTVKTLQNNNIGLKKHYDYYGCITHRTGLGFRGFECIVAKNDSVWGEASWVKYDLRSFEKVVIKEIADNQQFPLTTISTPTLTPTFRMKFTFDEDILPNNIHVIYPIADTIENFISNLFLHKSYIYTPSGGTIPSLYNYGKPDKVITEFGSGLEITEQEYTYSTTNPYFFNRCKPKDIITKHTRTGSSTYTQPSTYTYNPQGLVETVVINPGTSHQNSLSYSYDAFGNSTQETSVVAGTPTTTSIANYSTDGRFLIETINPLGQSEEYTLDVWGNVLSYKNINNLTATNTYDDFNRSIGSVSPTGVATTTSYDWANSLADCPTGNFFIAATNSIAGISGSSIAFSDYSGNIWRTVHNAFDGQKIYKDVEYLFRSIVHKKSAPYYSTASPNYTIYTYDIYERLLSETSPTCTKNYGYSYDVAGEVLITASNVTASPVRNSETTLDLTGKIKKITECATTSLIYEYGSNGRLSKTVANGLNTDYTYDSYDNLIFENAPNKNLTTFTYDNRNRLKTRTDANSATFTYDYDALNRTITKTGPDGPYNYFYDGSTPATFGQLIRAVSPYTATETNYTYDAFSRLSACTEQINGNLFTTGYTHDIYDRLQTTTYPDGNIIHNEYNSYGYFSGVGTTGTGSLPYTYLWRKDAENAFGQTTHVSYAPYGPVLSGIPDPSLYKLTNSFSTNGFLTSTKLVDDIYSTLSENIFNFNEATADLIGKADLVHFLSENYSYDNLDRLKVIATIAPFIGTTINSFEYAANGNITRKSDISPHDWKYAKYAVTEIPDPATAIPTFIQTATYTPFNKVKTLNEDAKDIVFYYKADDQRGMAQYFTGGILDKTRYYDGNYEKTIDALGNTEQISYIMAEGAPVAMITTNGTATDIKYIVTDYLGNITHVLNSGGTIDETRSYDAWGRPRNPYTWDYSGIPTYSYDRGYTSQEHLHDFNVINLNGRLYDPLIGRMFSVDRFIVDPGNSQAYNSYSYALNNPLKYTDKDGNEPVTAAVLVVAALVGGTINVANNWNKIQADPWSSIGYFAVGAGSGALSVVNPLAGGSMAVAGNFAMDHATGNIPKMDGAIDVAKYAGEKILDATAITGAGAIASAGFNLATTSSWHTKTMVNSDGIFTIIAKKSYTTQLGLSSGAAAGKYSVYFGVDENQIVRYVGMTGREASIRFGKHRLSTGTGKEFLNYRVSASELSKTEARILEQNMINHHGLGKNGGTLLNKYNSISPKYWGLYGIK